MSSDPDDPPGLFSRLRSTLHIPGTLVRIVRRDPHHVPERLTLYAVEQQAAAAGDWAARTLERAPRQSRALAADNQRRQTISTGRIDGAIAGTPFFIALVPAYVAFLRQELRMHLRIAALYGHDPADPRVAADFLVLRGVRKTSDEALRELEAVRATPLPPPGARTPVRSWYRAVVNILVLAGFLGAPEENDHEPTAGEKLVDAIRFVVAGLVWALTWVVPVTFMIVMSWACESDARRFSERVLTHYKADNEELADVIGTADQRSGRQRALNFARGALVVLSVAIPMLVVASTTLRHHGPLGLTIPDAGAALVALAMVIVVSVLAIRG